MKKPATSDSSFDPNFLFSVVGSVATTCQLLGNVNAKVGRHGTTGNSDVDLACSRVSRLYTVGEGNKCQSWII